MRTFRSGFFLGLMAVLWLTSACASPATDVTVPSATATPDSASVTPATPGIDQKQNPTAVSPTPLLPPQSSMPGTPTPDAIVGDGVPRSLMQPIMADLAQRTGSDQKDIAVLTSESVVWNDGSLGCPQPGQMYTQALVDGYRVVLSHGEQTYDYRASAQGFFMLCETSAPPATGFPGGGGVAPAK